MSTAITGTIGTRPTPRTSAETVSLPKPEALTVPVLIGDCATPLAGETVLGLLWRKLSKQNGDGAF